VFTPHMPNPAFPALALQRVIRCLEADLEATEKTRDLVRASPAGGDLSYLDRLIYKPWGAEFRVYEDYLTDIWLLHIRSKHRTSLHCHPHKHTALLCLEGKGTLSTCSGVQYALEPGVVLQIEPGAYHRLRANSKTGLGLIEVETPKDRFDLLRIKDDYRDVTDPYEGEDHAPLRLVEDDRTGTVPLALQPFVEQSLGGNRHARLRAPCSTGRYRFAVENGDQVHASSHLVFAIALEPRTATPRTVTVLGVDRLSSTAPQGLYLTIRTI
jgi:mannose-6-phosphate isomerase-like protein (cupin superfamily)